MPLAMPSLLQNVLEHPKAAYPLPPLVLFAEAEERGCVSFSLSVCFSMIQYSKEKTPMKSPLRLTEDYSDQCYITMTQLKPRFHETLVLCNRISKIAYSSFKSYWLSFNSCICFISFSSFWYQQFCSRNKNLCNYGMN